MEPSTPPVSKSIEQPTSTSESIPTSQPTSTSEPIPTPIPTSETISTPTPISEPTSTPILTLEYKNPPHPFESISTEKEQEEKAKDVFEKEQEEKQKMMISSTTSSPSPSPSPSVADHKIKFWLDWVDEILNRLMFCPAENDPITKPVFGYNILKQNQNNIIFLNTQTIKRYVFDHPEKDKCNKTNCGYVDAEVFRLFRAVDQKTSSGDVLDVFNQVCHYDFLEFNARQQTKTQKILSHYIFACFAIKHMCAMCQKHTEEKEALNGNKIHNFVVRYIGFNCGYLFHDFEAMFGLLFLRFLSDSIFDTVRDKTWPSSMLDFFTRNCFVFGYQTTAVTTNNNNNNNNNSSNNNNNSLVLSERKYVLANCEWIIQSTNLEPSDPHAIWLSQHLPGFFLSEKRQKFRTFEAYRILNFYGEMILQEVFVQYYKFPLVNVQELMALFYQLVDALLIWYIHPGSFFPREVTDLYNNLNVPHLFSLAVSQSIRLILYLAQTLHDPTSTLLTTKLLQSHIMFMFKLNPFFQHRDKNNVILSAYETCLFFQPFPDLQCRLVRPDSEEYLNESLGNPVMPVDPQLFPLYVMKTMPLAMQILIRNVVTCFERFKSRI